MKIILLFLLATAALHAQSIAPIVPPPPPTQAQYIQGAVDTINANFADALNDIYNKVVSVITAVNVAPIVNGTPVFVASDFWKSAGSNGAAYVKILGPFINLLTANLAAFDAPRQANIKAWSQLVGTASGQLTVHADGSVTVNP